MQKMSIVDKLLRRKPAEKSTAQPAVIYRAPMSIFGAGFVAEDIKSPFHEHIWTFACVRAIANAVSGVEMIVLQTNANGTEAATVSNPHNEWVKLFARPNGIMSGRQFWKAISTYYELYGQAFVVPRTFDGKVATGVPDVLDVLHSKYVQRIVSGNNFLGWKYQPTKETFKPQEVIRFYEFDPDNLLGGVSPTEVMRVSASMDDKSRKYNEQFFRKGGTIAGILSVDPDVIDKLGYTKDDLEQARAEFDAKTKGLGNAHSTPIVNGLKVQPIGTPHKEMGFSELMRLVREESIAAYGVTKNQVSLSDAVNRATAEVYDRQFFSQTIVPRLESFADAVNTTLMVGTGYKIAFLTEKIDALKGNRNEAIEGALNLRDLGYSLNEINEVQGLGMAEITEGWADRQVDTRLQMVAPTEDADEEADEGKSVKRLKTNKEFIETVVNGKNSSAFARKLNSYWMRLQKEQLKLIEGIGEGKGITKDVSSEYLFDVKEWARVLMRESLPFHAQAFKDSEAFLVSEVGKLTNFSMGDRAVQQALKKKNSLIQGVTQRFRNEVKRQIEEGLDANETTSQIAERLREQFGYKRSEALMTARTEVHQAAGALRQEAMKAEGFKKIWLDSKDESVRESHKYYASLGAKDINFEYATGLKFAGDTNGAAEESINCRCSMGVVR